MWEALRYRNAGLNHFGVMDTIMNNLLGFLSVLLVFPLFLGCQEVNDPWVELNQRDVLDGMSSYDKKSVRKTAEGNIRVLVRTVYTGENRKYISDFFGGKYENLSYVVNLEEVNCSERQYQIVSTALYDADDRHLYTKTHEKDNWEKVPPGSDVAELMSAVCKSP